LAEQEFARFLKNSSDEEKEKFNIYEYYSLVDVERLSGSLSTQDSSPEEGEDTTSTTETEEDLDSTSEDVEEETAGETEEESSEEVLTIVKFSYEEGHIMVPVVFNDTITATVLVDTGAGITILSRELAADLRLEEERGHSITLKTMASDVKAKLARVDSIQIGDLARNDFPVAITELPLGEKNRFRGILGMDFMNNYTIKIDNQEQIIKLSPR